MSEKLLREYLQEVLLTELSVDRPFVDMLRGKHNGIRLFNRGDDLNQNRVLKMAVAIAKEWIQEVEQEIGNPIRHGNQAQIIRYCTWKFPGLLQRFHGDHKAAEHTMYNLINSKFNTLRLLHK